MTMLRWLSLAAAACVAATGCSDRQGRDARNEHQRPQQAGKVVDPLVTAGHMARAEVAAFAGDGRGLRQHLTAMQHDRMRAMRIADPGRPINREAARAAVRSLAGVRSSVWIDRQNLLVMVGGSSYRSMATIDDICMSLQPLGDTLAVVVNLQDVTATTSEGADTLSRNCQLEQGERALFQPKRRVDALEPELRREFRAQQEEKL